jgi:shikimate kinase
MASGKTTVGHELARRTGWPYMDNDVELQAATGKSAPELRLMGEATLHAAELAVFDRSLTMAQPVIVGVAGSVVVNRSARTRLREAGTVVWLRARPETLLTRAGGGAGRRGEAVSLGWIEKVARERRPALEATATFSIDVDDLTPVEVADAIQAAVGNTRHMTGETAAEGLDRV